MGLGGKCTLKVSCRELECLIHHSDLDLISRASTEIGTNISCACGSHRANLIIKLMIPVISNLFVIHCHILQVSIIWLIGEFYNYCSDQQTSCIKKSHPVCLAFRVILLTASVLTDGSPRLDQFVL